MRISASLIVVAGLLAGAGASIAQPPSSPPPPPTVILPAPAKPAGPLPPTKPGKPLGVTDPRIVQKPRFDPAGATPDYPLASIRAGEEGEATVRVCVATDGKVIEAAMESSSGHASLDDATLKWVRGARFLPARTADGPVSVCDHFVTYVWDLKISRDASDSAFGSSGFYMGPYTMGQPMFPDIASLTGVTAPKLANTPAPPPFPGGAAPGPVSMKACVSAAGRAMMLTQVEGASTPQAMIIAMNWLNGLTFDPAMKDGKPIAVCGVPVEMPWKPA